MEVAATAGVKRRAMASGVVERGRRPRMTRGRDEEEVGREPEADEWLREDEDVDVDGREVLGNRREKVRAARAQGDDIAG